MGQPQLNDFLYQSGHGYDVSSQQWKSPRQGVVDADNQAGPPPHRYLSAECPQSPGLYERTAQWPGTVAETSTAQKQLPLILGKWSPQRK